MRDHICVRNLLVRIASGADAWSRKIAQPAFITVKIGLQHRLRHLALTDDINRTVNYDTLSETLRTNLESRAHLSIVDSVKAALQIVRPHLTAGESAEVKLNQPKAMLLARSHSVAASTNSTKVTETLNQVDLHTIIGINKLERVRTQQVLCDFTVEYAEPPTTPFFTQENVGEMQRYVESLEMLTIESFVNAVAEYLLAELKKSGHHSVEVRVKAGKPSALNMAEEAAVQVTRSSNEVAGIFPNTNKNGDHKVYIAFGTNMGDRTGNILRSIKELRAVGVEVERSSSIFESAPMYYTEQPPFLNGVFRCRTKLTPDELLKALKVVEYQKFQRVKHFDNGPRPLDLDIVLYDNMVISSEHLTVPHKDMLNRPFVLRPLNELLPKELQFPVTDTSLSELCCIPMPGANPLVCDPYANRAPGLMMGILNITPDSFSDGNGEVINETELLRRAEQHLANGARILDIGGCSTRPGAQVVSAEEERRRVAWALKVLIPVFPNALYSVDTFRGEVAREALKLGAQMVNDVFGGRLDADVAVAAAEYGAALVLGHARGTPQTMDTLCEYPTGVVDGVAKELRESVDAALKSGCQPFQLLLDPGFGFAKRNDQSLELVKHFNSLRNSKHFEGLPKLPWLVGPSRKRFIGEYSQSLEASKRVPGTIACVSLLRAAGASVVRVHDTAAVGEALNFTNSVYVG